MSINTDATDMVLDRGEAIEHIIETEPLKESRHFAVAATGSTLGHLTRLVSVPIWQAKRRYQITTRQILHQTILDQCRKGLLERASSGPQDALPHGSAAEPTSMAARRGWTLVSIGAGACVVATQKIALGMVFALLAVFFLLVTFLRCAAIARLFTGTINEDSTPSPEPGDWPFYTVLVPLHGEANMVEPILAALDRLDYPKDRLDIKLLLEASDTATVERARSLRLGDHVTILAVPQHSPQTKPKAMNIGLAFARGHYLTIYDAEDRPEPQQLKKAVLTFAALPDTVAVLQARLGFYNWDENWLARQFAVEYAVHFAALLPALRWLRLPIPLGGTSNHFKVAALRAAGAWDAHNVTEDADLGIRLHRLGFDCDLLDSYTLEEAACTWRNWLRQRTRWVKGWIQTWIVHMRTPRLYLRQRGVWSLFGLTIITGGMVLSPIAHALFVGSLICLGCLGLLWPLDPPWREMSGLASVHFFNFAIGYSAAIMLAALMVRRQALTRMRWTLVTIPAYWLLISVAAFRAFWKIASNPFEWEKTDHGVSGLSSRVRH